MLPFVVGGGILIAIAFLIDGFLAPNAGADFGSATPAAHFFKQVGGDAFGFMLPILAGYIAMAIADRPGLAVGFVGGTLANAGYNWGWLNGGAAVGGGFLGALFAGFAAGFFVKWLEGACDKLPDSLEGIKPVLLYPLIGILAIGIIRHHAIGRATYRLINRCRSYGLINRCRSHGLINRCWSHGLVSVTSCIRSESSFSTHLFIVFNFFF
jgi:fructose-specific phosphotransferase system IIC component